MARTRKWGVSVVYRFYLKLPLAFSEQIPLAPVPLPMGFILCWRQAGSSYLPIICAPKTARWVCVFIAMVAVALGPKGTMTPGKKAGTFLQEEN